MKLSAIYLLSAALTPAALRIPHQYRTPNPNSIPTLLLPFVRATASETSLSTPSSSTSFSTSTSTFLATLTTKKADTSTSSPSTPSPLLLRLRSVWTWLTEYHDTSCHKRETSWDSRYVYFTQVPLDANSSALGSDSSGLFYIKTPWHLTYKSALRRAILNDAEKTVQCPKGHCYSHPISTSTSIPDTRGTDSMSHASSVRLKVVIDPVALRARAGRTSSCGFLPHAHVHRLGVHLGIIGDWIYGTRLSEDVSAYIESRMRTTYPKLEMGLILGFTLALPGAVVVWVLVRLMLILVVCFGKMVAKIGSSVSAHLVGGVGCVRYAVGTVMDRVKGMLVRAREARRRRQAPPEYALHDMGPRRTGTAPPTYEDAIKEQV